MNKNFTYILGICNLLLMAFSISNNTSYYLGFTYIVIIKQWNDCFTIDMNFKHLQMLKEKSIIIKTLNIISQKHEIIILNEYM